MKLGKAIAQRIEFLCDKNNITLNKLATISGITQSTLHNIIMGNSENPKIKTLFMIAQAFNMSIIEFLDDETILNTFVE